VTQHLHSAPARLRRLAADSALVLLVVGVVALLRAPHEHRIRDRALASAIAGADAGADAGDPAFVRAELQAIVAAAVPPGSGEGPAAAALIEWMRANVPVRGGRHHPNPLVAVRRGGACGQLSFAFVQLVRTAGLSARQVLVVTEPSGRAAHALAEVRLGGAWVAHDPLGFGGGDHPSQPFVPVAALCGRGVSATELLRHPDALPDESAYGRASFAGAHGIRIEPGPDWTTVRTEAPALFGRDWPLLTRADATTDATTDQVVAWAALPFARVVFWRDGRPTVLHVEWVLALVAACAVVALRHRRRLGRRRLGLTLGGALVVVLAHDAALFLLWRARFG
jgi:hypothetical protein